MFVRTDRQCFTHATAGAIGGDHQPRGQRALAIRIGNANGTQAIIRHAIVVVDETDETRRPIAGQSTQFGQARFQRFAEITGDHDLPERFAPMVARIQLDPAEVADATDMDAADRAGRRAQCLQHAEGGERIGRGFGEAEVALVEYRRQRAGRRSFDQANVEAQPIERDRKAGADQPTADDQDVMVPGAMRPGIVLPEASRLESCCWGCIADGIEMNGGPEPGGLC